MRRVLNVGVSVSWSPGSRRAGSGLAIAFSVIFLCGCAGGGSKRACSKPQEYQASESTASLTVPGGLDEPDRSGELVIPELRDENGGPGDDQPCLEQPPDYFDRKL